MEVAMALRGIEIKRVVYLGVSALLATSLLAYATTPKPRAQLLAPPAVPLIGKVVPSLS
jgi:hypothetical protein